MISEEHIDIIILSYAKNEELKKLTIQSIDTLLASEHPEEIKFNVVVIESNKTMKPFQYVNSTTIYPNEKFGFHKYLNLGLNETANRYICFCNNDLIFHRGWASEITKSMDIDPDLKCFSTFCPNFHADKADQIENRLTYGYKNGVLFTGWCFLVKRDIFKIIGQFDERFKFWYCDDDFRLTLKKHNLKNALVKNAKVTHLYSETLLNVTSKNKMALQYSNFAYYKYKWHHNNVFIYAFESLKYKIKILLS